MSKWDTTFLDETGTPQDDPDPADHSFLEDLPEGAGAGTEAAPTPVGADRPAAVSDLGPPYLFVDLYPLDLGPNPPWSVLESTSGYVGAIIKAMEGTGYRDGGWFKANWPRVRDAGGHRYGETWFRGAYLFLRFAVDGADQADAYLGAVDAAGGWEDGDILPIVDVERGKPTNPNYKANAQQVIDCTTACADRIREQTGRRVMLYGRGAMRDLGINDRMGCDIVWNPAYTSYMVRNGLQAWALEDIALWQYCGDGVAAYAKLPHNVPGFGHGKVDISVYIQGAEKPDLPTLRQRLID
jgi:hypothetical protein